MSYTIECNKDKVPKITFSIDHHFEDGDIDEAISELREQSDACGIEYPYEFYIGQDGLFHKSMQMNKEPTP